MARTSTYLNFDRQTEEAFNFYKSVFGGEFIKNSVSRFSSIPATKGIEPIKDEDEDLISHIELSILGGHVLMGSDSPKSRGFLMNFGNNSHINLEFDSEAETQKIFYALSKGGKITMELQNMFWGAYYGSCVDKFGVQWMFNFIKK